MDFSFLNQAVKRQQMIGKVRESADGEAIHIAYGIDDKFVMPMGVAILSILEYNRQENIVFHVLAECLSSDSIGYLERLAKSHEVRIMIHYIDGEVFSQLPSTEHFTKATYNRFLLTKVLRGTAKRVIYLDADILCYGSLAELKTLDFADHIVAVVQDIGAVADRQIPVLKLKDRRYFNAGFLYIDIEQWEMAMVSERALTFSFAHLGKLNWLDQDALNFVLNEKALFIEGKYNYIFDFGIKENRHLDTLPSGTVFVHYAGRYKPWHAWCMHPLQKDFLYFFQQSPWRGQQLQQPQNYKDMKKMANSHISYGRIGEGLLWYFRYACHKIKASLG